MLTIKECRKYLLGKELTDNQVEELRDAMYALVEQALDELLEVQEVNK